MTPDGVHHVLTTSGFHVEALWPQESWTVFDSLAAMSGPVSAPSRWALGVIARLERSVRTRQWHPRALRTGSWLRRRTEEERHRELLVVTGQVDFCARRT